MNASEAAVRQIRRRRVAILTMIRQGHEEQLQRLDDFGVWATMQDVGLQMSRNAIITMLQDMCVLGYIVYKQGFSEKDDRVALREIELTPKGLTHYLRRQSNDDLLFD